MFNSKPGLGDEDVEAASPGRFDETPETENMETNVHKKKKKKSKKNKLKKKKLLQFP